MRRTGLRALMVLVGVGPFVAYAGVAYLGYRALAAVWLVRGDLLSVLAWTTALTVLLGYLSYRFGTVRLLSQVQAVDLPRSRAPALHARLDGLADRMDVARPRLLVGRIGAPNAMAVGGIRGGAVVLDRSLLFLLSPDELEALLAHELAHLESRDSLVQTLAYSAGQSLVGFVVARALRKIQRATDPPWTMRSPLYVRGDEDGALTRLLSTHPDVDDRIDRLVERADSDAAADRRIEVR